MWNKKIKRAWIYKKSNKFIVISRVVTKLIVKECLIKKFKEGKGIIKK